MELSEVQPPIDPAQSDMTGELERKQTLTAALALTGNTHRKVLELVCYQGLTLREAAEAMGESLENVRHYYYRGLKKIRDQLGIANRRVLNREARRPQKQEVPNANS